MPDLKIKNPTSFCEKFLKEYLAGGLGRMQKRDIDIFVLYLLMNDKQYSFPKDIFKATRDLKLTEARVRNLYQEVQLRYQQMAEEQAKAELVDIVKNNAFEVKGKRFVFVVRNPMLGQYFQEWVASVEGFTDSSFNSNIVSIDRSVFLEVLKKISVNRIKKFPENLNIFNEPESNPGVLKLFVAEFAKSAGNEAGRLSVGGLAMALGLILGIPG